MAEMLLAPSLPPDEIDSEREVVLEEIAMYEDEPQDRVHDVLAEAIYGDHPLGRRVLGRAEVIGGDPGARHRRATTTPATRPTTSSSRAAGHLEHARIVELAERLLQPAGASGERAPNGAAAGRAAAAALLSRRRPSSTTSASAVRASRARDERRFALGVLDTIFGGSVSSRLFREVREKRGLAYSVGSYTQRVRRPRASSRCTSAPAPTTSPRPARSSAASWSGSAREGVGDEELARAKEHVKGRHGARARGDRRRGWRRLARGDAVRRPAALARRDARARRRGQRRRGRRARRRALRPEQARRRLRRARRGLLPRRRRRRVSASAARVAA